MSLILWLLFCVSTLLSHLVTNDYRQTLVFSTILNENEGRTSVQNTALSSCNQEWFVFTPSHALCR